VRTSLAAITAAGQIRSFPNSQSGMSFERSTRRGSYGAERATRDLVLTGSMLLVLG
jgi:hypothetical protein